MLLHMNTVICTNTQTYLHVYEHTQIHKQIQTWETCLRTNMGKNILTNKYI